MVGGLYKMEITPASHQTHVISRDLWEQDLRSSSGSLFIAAGYMKGSDEDYIPGWTVARRRAIRIIPG